MALLTKEGIVLPNEKLTEIKGVLADVPTDETTPEFMNNKFNELLENDKYIKGQLIDNAEQINNLSVKVEKSDSGNKTTLSSLINEKISKGIYSSYFDFYSCSDVPFSDGWGCSCYYRLCSDSRIYVEVVRSYTNEPYINQYMDQETIDDTKWQLLATTKKTEIPFPYASGVIDRDGYAISRVVKINNTIHVHIAIKKQDGGAFGSWETIATLPVGYRPSKDIYSGGSCLVGEAYGACGFYIGSSGYIQPLVPLNATEVMATLIFEV